MCCACADRANLSRLRQLHLEKYYCKSLRGMNTTLYPRYEVSHLGRLPNGDEWLTWRSQIRFGSWYTGMTCHL
jgi:hypothetical protein